MKIFDISIVVEKNTVIWPGNIAPGITSIRNIKKGDISNDTQLMMNVHTGTHIEAPLHFSSNGKSVDKISLNVLIGKVFVAYLPKAKKITAHDIRKLKIPKGIDRILFKTSNSLLWKKKASQFKKSYVGLNTDAAQLLVQMGLKLVGVDYLSVATFDEIIPVHQILLKKKVVLLEGIDLAAINPGIYELICLPLKILNIEAAPVRAILIRD